jgi:hypothetical protein
MQLAIMRLPNVLAVQRAANNAEKPVLEQCWCGRPPYGNDVHYYQKTLSASQFTNKIKRF